MFKLVTVLALIFLTAPTLVAAKDASLDSVKLLMKRAELYQNAGRLEEADALYSQVLGIDRKNCDALNQRANNYLVLEQYQKALDDCNRCIEMHPGYDYYLLRSFIFMRMGKAQAAASDLDHCWMPKGIPFCVEFVLIHRSIAHMESGQYHEALADASTHLNIVPRSILSFELASEAAALCGQPADSIAYLTQFAYTRLHGGSELHNSQDQVQYSQWPMVKYHTAAELHTFQYQAQYKAWAELNFRQGSLTNRERRELVARLDKNHAGLSPAQFHFARGITYFYDRDYAGAIAEAAQCASGNMRIYSDLLNFHCQISKRDFPQAAATLSSLTSLFPDSQPVVTAIDLYHYGADKRESGIAEIKALLAQNPKNQAALVELAKIYRDLSQSEEALKYCNMALQRDSGNADLLLLKANILASQEKFAEALKCLGVIIAANKQDGAAYMERAAIRTQEGHWADAAEDLTQTIRLKYDLFKSYRARAACYSELKKTDLARQDFEMVKAIDPVDAERLQSQRP